MLSYISFPFHLLRFRLSLAYIQVHFAVAFCTFLQQFTLNLHLFQVHFTQAQEAVSWYNLYEWGTVQAKITFFSNSLF